MAGRLAALCGRGRVGRCFFSRFAARSRSQRVVAFSAARRMSKNSDLAGCEILPPVQALPARLEPRMPVGAPPPDFGAAPITLANAVLARVCAVVPVQFLKTPDNIHCHKKVLHHVLLNNLSLHDTLSGKTGAGRPAPPPTAHDRARIATEAVQFMQRTAAIAGLAHAYTCRNVLRSSSGSSGAHNRLCNPLAAYFGAPGGGKTTVLELAAELTTAQSWSSELCPDLAMRVALNDSIAVTVTYNSGMDAAVSMYDADPEVGLALRVLYSALVQDVPEAYSFGQFWSDWTVCAVKLPVPLNLQLAIDACMLAFSKLTPHRTGILLLVDETRKLAEAFELRTGRGISNRTNPAYEMLGAVGRALDFNRPAVFNVACTTLDSLMFRALSTASGRKIDWISLDGLRQPAAEALVMRALGRADHVPALIALGIADCARHPRTLESLTKAFFLRAVERGSRPDWAQRPGELKLIRELVSSTLNSATPLWALLAALNGVALSYDAVIEGSGGVTFGDAIATGVFLNTVETDSKGTVDVPRLSFMHLLFSAEALPGPVGEAIIRMAAQEEACLDSPRMSSGTPFDGVGFEGFVLQWLQLRFSLSAAAGNGRGLSLEELFALKFSNTLPTAAWQSLSRRIAMGSHSFPRRFRHVVLPGVDFAKAVKDPISRGLINEVIADGGGVVTFIANNPAFDILLLVHDAGAGVHVVGGAPLPPIAIAIEARFSTPTSKKRSTAEVVTSKVKLFNAHFGPGGAFATLGIPANRVAYVLMASRLDWPQARSTPQNKHQPPSERGLTAQEKDAFLAQGIVILDRHGVERALTPTLVDRAFFLLKSPLVRCPVARRSS